MSKVTLRKMQGPFKTCPACKHTLDSRAILVKCSIEGCTKHECSMCSLKHHYYCKKHYNQHTTELQKLQTWQPAHKMANENGGVA